MGSLGWRLDVSDCSLRHEFSESVIFIAHSTRVARLCPTSSRLTSLLLTSAPIVNSPRLWNAQLHRRKCRQSQRLNQRTMEVNPRLPLNQSRPMAATAHLHNPQITREEKEEAAKRRSPTKPALRMCQDPWLCPKQIKRMELKMPAVDPG